MFHVPSQRLARACARRRGSCKRMRRPRLEPLEEVLHGAAGHRATTVSRGPLLRQPHAQCAVLAKASRSVREVTLPHVCRLAEGTEELSPARHERPRAGNRNRTLPRKASSVGTTCPPAFERRSLRMMSADGGRRSSACAGLKRDHRLVPLELARSGARAQQRLT